MLVMRPIEDTTNPVGELVSFRQPLGLDHFALAVYPLGLYGVMPRALCLGKGQLMMLTPQPLFLTRRLCWPSQRLTSLEISTSPPPNAHSSISRRRPGSATQSTARALPATTGCETTGGTRCARPNGRWGR